jgi:protein farnesyltransferase subunit beta
VLLPEPRPPLGEAHGGYTFCALASWVMLQPFMSDETSSWTKPSINLKTLLRWLSQMQGAEIELGGFRGRTNKLVDGCYSWWVGGSFALLEALGLGGSRELDSEHEIAQDDEDVWSDDADGPFHIAHSITRFVISAQIPSSIARHYKNTSFMPVNIQLAD